MAKSVGGECDRVALVVRQSQSVCCHHHILLGVVSLPSLVVFSLWQVIFPLSRHSALPARPPFGFC